jgi:hypothetical protein
MRHLPADDAALQVAHQSCLGDVGWCGERTQALSLAKRGSTDSIYHLVIGEGARGRRPRLAAFQKRITVLTLSPHLLNGVAVQSEASSSCSNAASWKFAAD